MEMLSLFLTVLLDVHLLAISLFSWSNIFYDDQQVFLDFQEELVTIVHSKKVANHSFLNARLGGLLLGNNWRVVAYLLCGGRCLLFLHATSWLHFLSVQTMYLVIGEIHYFSTQLLCLPHLFWPWEIYKKYCVNCYEITGTLWTLPCLRT